MKHYVCTEFRKNEQGFTFLSMLLTVTILFTTLPLLAYLIKSVNYSSNYDEIAVQQFFNFLQNDVIHATSYQIENGVIKLVLPNESKNEDDEIASFQKYDTLIRRQVDEGGHEIYLRDIEDFTVTSLAYGFHVTILSLQGERYEKTIVFYD